MTSFLVFLAIIVAVILYAVGIEAAIEQGWHKWIGDGGKFIGMNGFGASAPFKTCFENFGITTANVVAAAKETIG